MHILISFLKNEDYLKNEGIFRRTGSLERQQELKGLISRGVAGTLESGTYNVHDCASVLKSFLAELAEPLLTEAHFPTYCQIAETYGIICSAKEAKLLEILQLLVLLLPPENRELLGDILNLLNLTASFHSYNKMDTDNLAKLFMPHLLCPRNLSPEVLLKGSQKLFGIISFMIKKSSDLFKVPQKLVLDFRAKYEKKKVLSPTKRLNESISDTASTVFTFVDQERTAKENESNPTETALAQLYAHIQSLPESSKKRKLVKQFNKENGNGTPCQFLRGCNQPKNRSLGDAIKRRIFQKNLATKKELLFRCSSSYDIPQSPPESPHHCKSKGLLFCHRSYDSTEDLCINENPSKKLRHSSLSEESSEFEERNTDLVKQRSFSEPNLNSEVDPVGYVTSTPARIRNCDVFATPDAYCRRSMSPITRSTQRMSQTMQESMMTPRSRKPVLLLSGTSICTLHGTKLSNEMSTVSENTSDNQSTDRMPLLKKSWSEGDVYNISKADNANGSLSGAFKNYLHSRNIEVVSPQSSLNDSSFSSRADDFDYMEINEVPSDVDGSLLQYLDAADIASGDSNTEERKDKEPILKPRRFDKEGKPIIFETSF
nr:unnamed protein product [Callosobruchus analis]